MNEMHMGNEIKNEELEEKIKKWVYFNLLYFFFVLLGLDLELLSSLKKIFSKTSWEQRAISNLACFNIMHLINILGFISTSPKRRVCPNFLTKWL